MVLIIHGSQILFLGSDVEENITRHLEKGITNVCGCADIDSLYVYRNKVEDIHFPTDHFETIVYKDDDKFTTMAAQEIFRILEQTSKGGKFIFYANESSNIELIKIMLATAGLDIADITRDDADILINAIKPIQHRTKILLPPGIGDVYWPLVKIQSFLEREGITPPVDAYIAAPRAKQYNSHERAFPFLRMFPFLHSMDTVLFDRKSIVWKEAYLHQGQTIFRNVLECDYFITWNGHQRAGRSLEEVDPDIKCNWYPPRFVSLKEEQYRKSSVEKYGDYLVLYWVFAGGANSLILNHFSLDEIAASLNRIIDETKLLPVIVGAIWDKDDLDTNRLISMLPKNTVDLRSQTTIEQIFGLMRGAKAVVGMPSGITIMSAVFGIKTILLWDEYYTTGGVHRDFAWNGFPPDVRGRTYFAEYADCITAEGFTSRVLSVISDIPYIAQESHNRQAHDRRIALSQSRASRRRRVDRNQHVSIRSTGFSRGPISIACVYRHSNDFNLDYVMKLRNMISRNVTVPYEFVCLSNENIGTNGMRCIQFQNNYHGYWSKIELFRQGIFTTEYVFYLDLDTIILSNINDLLQLNYDFIGLRPWNEVNRNKGMFASGVMLWRNGMFPFIYDEFNPDIIQKFRSGDQEYISSMLISRGYKYEYFQDKVHGIYSFKRNCRPSKPGDARIICFHGRPRIHTLQQDWIRDYWR